MKRKLFTHFIGFILFAFLAVSSLFATMFLAYQNYSDKIKNAAPQIQIGMNLTEVEKLIGKADEIKAMEGNYYVSWNVNSHHNNFLEGFGLTDSRDYSHLNLKVSMDNKVIGLF